jgi:hypothetical protein
VSQFQHDLDRAFMTRAAALLSILVLVSVPAMTRVGQKLDPRAQGPSFSRNIDCPPKKVSEAPVVATVASPLPSRAFDLVPVARLAAPPDETLLPPPHNSTPVPLRAPPSASLV